MMAKSLLLIMMLMLMLMRRALQTGLGNEANTAAVRRKFHTDADGVGRDRTMMHTTPSYGFYII